VSDIVDAHVAYCKTISDLNMDKAELRERIKRLEEAGGEMVSEEDTYIRLQTWLKAKDEKP